ncbi:hypothetical protein SLA2020_109900 [Shorea laevis]
MFAVSLLTDNGSSHESSSLYSLLKSFRSLIQLLDQVHIRHIFREVNGVADALAKYEASMGEQLLFFDSVPDFCMNYFVQDRTGNVVYQTTCKT